MISSLTVGIVFKDESKNLSYCLYSLQNLKAYVQKFKVVLVDNASTDDSVSKAQELLLELGLDGQVIQRRYNHMAQARNDVIQNTTTRFLYFTDADCELQPFTWTELANAMRDHPDCAAWGGGVEFPPTSSAQIALSDMRKSFWGHLGSSQMMEGLKPSFVSHLSTTHVLYDLEKVREVGGFDNRLGEAAEDLDLSLRLRARGFSLLFVPSSRVLHHQVQTYEEWFKKSLRNGIWQTRLLAYNRHILQTLRPWPALIVWFLVPYMSWMLLGYLIVIVFTVFSESRPLSRQLRLLVMYGVTHFHYLMGEIFGLFLAIKDRTEPMETKV